MSLTTQGAKEVARLGAHIEITEKSAITTQGAKEIIAIATEMGSKVTVHASKYTSQGLKEMVRLGNGNITIVI